MKKQQLLKMHLQFFAEGGEDGTPKPVETPAINLDELNEEQLASIKEKFGFKDDIDIDVIMKGRKAKWQKEQEAKEAEKNEAARLAQLSEEERQQALIQKEKEAFEAEKAKFQQERLFVEKGKQLVAEGMPAEFANRIVGDTAEEILADVKALRSEWDKAVEAKVNERLANKTQTRVGGTGEALTKADIMKVKDATERQRLIAQNRELF